MLVCPQKSLHFDSRSKTIKKELGVDDWEHADEDQLNKRDKIHMSIKLLSKVLTVPDQIVRVAIDEHK